MKKLNLVALLAMSGALMACGNGNQSCPVASEQSQQSSQVAAEAKLEHSFISTATLSYSNMRPTYNYYLTTFSFQTLELYDNASYRLTISSSTFSAVILPEEGNAATGNERANSLLSYWGTYTAKVDELDDEALLVDISAPNRIVGVDDEKGFIDTNLWNDTMKKNYADVEYGYDAETQTQVEKGRKEYATGAEYLAAHSYKAVKEVLGSTKTGTLDTIKLDWGK